MMVGTTSAHVARTHLPGAVDARCEIEDMIGNNDEGGVEDNDKSADESDEGDIEEDIGPVSGSRALSSVKLASHRGGLIDLLNPSRSVN
jgi:hypothetical protein